MKKIITLCFLTFLLNQFLTAQPTLVKDINEGSGSSYALNETTDYTLFNDMLYFTADDGINGYELWKSDGTTAGTEMVFDIFAGSGGSIPSDIVVLNNQLLFFAEDSQNGRELWQSDGTASGTSIVKGINPGNADAILSSFNTMTIMGDYAYFSAFEATNGEELWRTDGTELGTTIVTDLWAGSNSSLPRGFTVMNDILYFSANGGVTGTELYRSDGSEAGTYLLKDISSSTFGSSPSDMTVVENTMFFTATDLDNGKELWKTDGTEVGTELVKDLEPGTASSFSNNENLLFSYNGNLLFATNTTDNEEDLWLSDGTEAGTVVLKAFTDGFQAEAPLSLTIFNNEVYFYGFDDAVGDGLWKTDGTTGGTELIRAFSGNITALKREMISLGDRLVFVAKEDFSTGFELWESNGTTAGTNIIGDINPGSFDSGPSHLIDLNGTALFLADDGTIGRELWSYNPEALPVSSTIQQTADILCNGDATAALLVTPSGGTGPYDYVWNVAGVVGNNPTDLVAGLYDVTVSDANGATSSNSIVINEPTEIVLSLDATPSTGGGANGTATVVPNGGTPFYTYLWNTIPAQTSSTAVNLLPGDYIVTVTDANDCTSEGLVLVDFTEGVEDKYILSQVEVYPTITTGAVILKFEETFQMEYAVLNLYGQIVDEGIVTSGQIIDLNEIPVGAYFIQLKHKQESVSKRIIRIN